MLCVVNILTLTLSLQILSVQLKIGILLLPCLGWTLITAPLGLDSNSTDDLIIIAGSKLSVYNDIQPLLLSPLYDVLIDQIF